MVGPNDWFTPRQKIDRIILAGEFKVRLMEALPPGVYGGVAMEAVLRLIEALLVTCHEQEIEPLGVIQGAIGKPKEGE